MNKCTCYLIRYSTGKSKRFAKEAENDLLPQNTDVERKQVQADDNAQCCKLYQGQEGCIKTALEFVICRRKQKPK